MVGTIALVSDATTLTKTSEGGGYNAAVDDRLLTEALGALGYAAQRVAWDRPEDWSQFAGIVLRSPWNYVDRLSQFRGWLEQVSTVNVVINHRALVEWNLKKTYLAELAESGVAVVPTLYTKLEAGPKTLTEISDEMGWNEVVVKPVVSASSRDTYRVDRSTFESFEVDWARLCRKQAMMIQPFRESIVDFGELSLVFFAGEFSHAIHKRGAAGEFRVQQEFGGSYRVIEPGTAMLRLADCVLQTLPQPPSYCRIDLVRDLSGAFELIELELIEPELWLREQPEAPARFAQAIADSLVSARAGDRMS